MTLSAPNSCKVYTPQTLADAIVAALGDDDRGHWLEPSVGTGVFLRSLANTGVEPFRIVALDLDTHAGPNDDLADTLRGHDFLAWSLKTNQKFARIAGNPPYVTLSRLAPLLRQAATMIQTPANKSVSLKTNYWYAFVCACLSVLSPEGCLGLVLPASWDYADYCADLRESMPKLFERFEVHRSLRPLFEGVGEGSIVILGYGYGKSHVSSQRFEYQDLEGMVEILMARKDFCAWEHISEDETLFEEDYNGQTCLLHEVANVHIGAVTGDAKFFLLTEQQKHERGLPDGSCRPILTRAIHLTAGETSQDAWEWLQQQGERVWLFAPPNELLEHPCVKRYINLPETDGGCNRNALWVSRRDPWYTVQLPQNVDGFLSGMSRNGPWVCFNNYPDLTVSNTLYTITFLDNSSQEAKYAWALSMLTSFTHKGLSKSRRFYADGLTKHEPRDLKQLRLLKPIDTTGAQEYYLKTIDLLLSGYLFQARRQADEWFARQRKLANALIDEAI